MRMYGRWLVGLCNRVAYASLLGVYVWLGATTPSLWSIGPLRLLTRVCDFPVALAGLVVPAHPLFIDLFFGRGIQEWAFVSPPQVLLWHLRVSIPVYVLLFYALGQIASALRRRHFLVKSESQVGMVSDP